MLKGYFKTISFLIALVWSVSVNHCAIESFFQNSTGNKAVSGCAGHQKDDPASHPQGKPCSTDTLNAQPQKPLTPAYVFIATLPQVLIDFKSEQILTKNEFSKFNENINTLLSDQIESLTLASNAPPFPA